MEDRAFKLFQEAWDKIKDGDYFDETNNHTFEYMLKSLWNSKYKNHIKNDIQKHLPKLIEQIGLLETPPPYIYILISVKDGGINKTIQEYSIVSFIKNNASEASAFSLLNLVETFHEKNIPIEHFVSAIVHNLKVSMNRDMLEALAYMISIQHPEFIRKFLEKFLSFGEAGIPLCKYFVQVHGRRGLLELTQLAPPNKIKKILS